MHSPLLRFGAAGLSPLRNKALSQPATASALKVNPAPMVVADKNSLQVAAHATTHSSFWKADQALRFDADRDVGSSQVAELAEVGG